MKKLILTAVSILIFACAPEKETANCYNAVTISNTSNKVIYFGGVSATPQIQDGRNPLNSGDYFKIISGTSKKDIFGRDSGCYEDLFKENNDTLYYIVFDEQVLLNYTWEDIVANDLVLKRYSFTLNEMREANWKVIYDRN